MSGKMARINVSAVIKKLIDGLGLSAAFEKVPVEVAEKVLPVFNVNPDPEIQIKEASASDFANDVLVHQCHATKRTFLSFVRLSFSKNASATSITTQLNITPKGKAQVPVMQMRYEPLTAGSESNSLSPPLFIELEKGSDIRVGNSTTVASIDGTAGIGFFEVDEV